MILHLKKNISETIVRQLADSYEAVVVKGKDGVILITPWAVKSVESSHDTYIEEKFVMDSDIQLASTKYMKDKRTVKLGNNLFGGSSRNVLVAIGPCGIESEEQVEQSARLIRQLGLSTLRAGAFKPRTSPYTFQGMGIDGLKLLAKIREKYGFSIISEVRDSSHVEVVIEYADMIQIGAKAMYDHGILRACGKTNKPIMLKRGFGATLQEFVQAAEFILSGGNDQVMLCERGIRTFETKTRFTLDLCGVAYLKENTNLPVILDPSHAMGYAYGVPDLARACMAMDVEGLLIEVHPDPSVARSDASQQLNHPEFAALFDSLNVIAKAVNRKIV